MELEFGLVGQLHGPVLQLPAGGENHDRPACAAWPRSAELGLGSWVTKPPPDERFCILGESLLPSNK